MFYMYRINYVEDSYELMEEGGVVHAADYATALKYLTDVYHDIADIYLTEMDATNVLTQQDLEDVLNAIKP